MTVHNVPRIVPDPPQSALIKDAAVVPVPARRPRGQLIRAEEVLSLPTVVLEPGAVLADEDVVMLSGDLDIGERYAYEPYQPAVYPLDILLSHNTTAFN